MSATVCPGSPAPGRIDVTVGTSAATTKNSIVVCPLSVVTMSSRTSADGVAVGAIVRVAVSVVSLGVATSAIATSEPVMMSAAPVRLVPVSVSGTVAPTSPAAGEASVTIGGGRFT